MKKYNLGEIEHGATGIDAFFASEPQIVSPLPYSSGSRTASAKPGRTKVGSLQQLDGFQRIGADTLVHKSTRDLWAIRQEGGEFFIERLFQDDGAPLKG